MSVSDGRSAADGQRLTSGTVPRFGHGSRVPGWDASVDLSKDPAVVPDAATTPVPDELRAADRRLDGQVP